MKKVVDIYVVRTSLYFTKVEYFFCKNIEQFFVKILQFVKNYNIMPIIKKEMMDMNQLEKNETYDNRTFEDIKHIDENGIEYWYARELQKVLDYKEWRKFENVIKKAKEACQF